MNPFSFPISGIMKVFMEFDKGTNILYGDNAQGKTNILESVYLCGTSKSHKGSKDKEMIRFQNEESHIRMMVKKDGLSYKIDMHLRKNRAKGVAINGLPIKKSQRASRGGQSGFLFSGGFEYHQKQCRGNEDGFWIWSFVSLTAYILPSLPDITILSIREISF